MYDESVKNEILCFEFDCVENEDQFTDEKLGSKNKVPFVDLSKENVTISSDEESLQNISLGCMVETREY